MKRKLIATISLLLVLAILAGCSGTTTSSNPVLTTTQGSTDKYPEREITIIVPYAPGGTMDTAARQIQSSFAKHLGKPVVIDNRDGAGGQLGLTLGYNEKQDGYVIVGMPTPHLEFILALNSPGFSLADLEFIGGMTSDIDCLRVRKDAPWNTLQEFIDDAKKRPGEISFGISSLTSDNYLGIKTLEKATGTEFNIVDFGGGNPARIALVGGKVDAVHTNVFSSLHIADDTKVLGVQSDTNPFPDITDNAPTFNEALNIKVPALATGTFLMTTKKFRDSYPERYNELVKAFKAAIEDQEYLKMMSDIGESQKIIYHSPEEMRAILQSTLNAVDEYRDLWKK